MSDITMCSSVTCEMRDKCYRARANPDPFWQSYCNFEEHGCDSKSGFSDYIKYEQMKR